MGSRRVYMWLRFIAVSLLALAFCSADTLTLRSGRVITGQYLGGDARHIRMAVGDRVDTFDVEDIGDLEFSGEASAKPGSQPHRLPSKIGTTKRRHPLRPPGPPPVTGIQIPAGTPITVRMIDKRGFRTSHAWARPSAPAWMNPSW